MSRKFGWDALAESAAEAAAANVYQLKFMHTGDSPIEHLMAAALHWQAHHENSHLEIGLVEQAHENPDALAKHLGILTSSRVVIATQAQLPGWRVDFLVHAHTGDFDMELGRFTKEWWKALIVECDGHDFHERTKEQAARDRGRDRQVQLAGFTVLRFTGSEIWRDPWACARQVFDWVNAG